MFEPMSFEVDRPQPAPSQWNESLWDIPIRMAIADGERDENRLTDRFFYLGHPELHGRRLQPNERKLIQEWLDIRDRLVRPRLRGFLAAPPPRVPPAPKGAFVWYSSPLPPSEMPRFTNALAKLESRVNASGDLRKWRYQCWINKLKNNKADDRVIGWHAICPSTGVVPFYILPCDISMGFPIERAELVKAIRSVSDIDTSGASLGIVTYLRSHIVVSEEMTSLPLENLRMLHDDVVMAVEKLGMWADVPLGGSSSMPTAYVSIKDWIGTRQRDSNSIYSCV